MLVKLTPCHPRCAASIDAPRRLRCTDPKLKWQIYIDLCSRTELWLTYYDSTKSYKLEQRLSQGSRQARRNSGSAKRNLCEHKHMFNRCSTSASARACAIAGPLAEATG